MKPNPLFSVCFQLLLLPRVKTMVLQTPYDEKMRMATCTQCHNCDYSVKTQLHIKTHTWCKFWEVEYSCSPAMNQKLLNCCWNNVLQSSRCFARTTYSNPYAASSDIMTNACNMCTSIYIHLILFLILCADYYCCVLWLFGVQNHWPAPGHIRATYVLNVISLVINKFKYW